MSTLVKVVKFVVNRPLASLGVAITIGFGTATLLLALLAFEQRRPHISFQIVNETDVLDVRESVQDLSILFRGQRIQEENQNLRIFTLRLENDGQADISQGLYDKDDIWGFRVDDGEIVETRLADSNSEYIRSNLEPTTLPGNIVQFSKIIFDRGEWFSIDLLVLHSKNASPLIIPIGKIAGISAVIPTVATGASTQPSLASQLFDGSWEVQVLRGMVFGIIYIAVLSILTLPLSVVLTVVLRRIRTRRRQQRERILEQEST